MQSKELIDQLRKSLKLQERLDAKKAADAAYDEANQHSEPFSTPIPRYAALMEKAVESESTDMLVQALYVMADDYFWDVKAKLDEQNKQKNPLRPGRRLISDIPLLGEGMITPEGTFSKLVHTDGIQVGFLNTALLGRWADES